MQPLRTYGRKVCNIIISRSDMHLGSAQTNDQTLPTLGMLYIDDFL